MSWKITFFNEKVEEETLSFPGGILANFLHISEMIEKFGPAIVNLTPHRWVEDYSKYGLKAKKVLAGRFSVR